MSWIVVKGVPGRRVPWESAPGRYFAEGVAVRVADTRFVRLCIAAGDLEETAEAVTTIVAGPDEATPAAEPEETH